MKLDQDTQKNVRQAVKKKDIEIRERRERLVSQVNARLKAARRA